MPESFFSGNSPNLNNSLLQQCSLKFCQNSRHQSFGGNPGREKLSRHTEEPLPLTPLKTDERPIETEGS